MKMEFMMKRNSAMMILHPILSLNESKPIAKRCINEKKCQTMQLYKWRILLLSL
jgi:hypothetical protein